MRIDNSNHRNNSNAFQKKKKVKIVGKKEKKPHEESNQVDLSGEIIFLSRLLDAPEHQYKALPFYFPNTALRNTQRISAIAKSIQQKATYQGINLNYDMILDLVLSHSHSNEQEQENKTNANANANANAKTNQDYQHTPLRNEEALFFEEFHNKSIESQLNPILILSVVNEYENQMKIKNAVFTNPKKQASQLRWIINNSSDVAISNNKVSLISALESIILETT